LKSLVFYAVHVVGEEFRIPVQSVGSAEVNDFKKIGLQKTIYSLRKTNNELQLLISID